ncbi:hypothetical protein JL722_4074 [Aureococcus anophagefferens]|nr:hypothetical protein JL722_4074 [Aureococcus anophagefferens]
MKIIISFQDVRLSMTLPKKWKRGPVSAILESYLQSPTAKRLGLDASSDVALERGDGSRLGGTAIVGESVRDGDVLRVRAAGEPRPGAGAQARVASRQREAAAAPARRALA